MAPWGIASLVCKVHLSRLGLPTENGEIGVVWLAAWGAGVCSLTSAGVYCPVQDVICCAEYSTNTCKVTCEPKSSGPTAPAL